MNAKVGECGGGDSLSSSITPFASLPGGAVENRYAILTFLRIAFPMIKSITFAEKGSQRR